MMEGPNYKGWKAIQLGDIAKHLTQYKPYVATVIAIALITTLLPGAHQQEGGLAGIGEQRENEAPPAGGPSGSYETPGAISESTAPATPGSTGVGSSGDRYGSSSLGSAGSGLSAAYRDPLAAPDCDRVRGTIKMPILPAPVCVPLWKGSNGGATSRGVTGNTITVVVYMGQQNEQLNALYSASGAPLDSDEQMRQMYRDWTDLFQHHLETYGRKVKLVFMMATGTDAPARRADAVEIATEIKAFAVLTMTVNPAFEDELAARKVLLISMYPATARDLNEHAPFVWGPALMDFTSTMHQAAEFLGKRVWGRKAKFAGDPTMQTKPRVLGLIAPPAASDVIKYEVDHFFKELAKYGAKVKVWQSYAADMTTAQAQANTVMAKFKDEGVTTVILGTDPLSPIFFTQAATNQAYFPEWFVTGSYLTDTNFYGRLYDQSQWSHAFGLRLSMGLPLPKTMNPWFELYEWHFGKGKEVPGKQNYLIIYHQVAFFFEGVHYAGPKLTPYTFRDGLFAYRSKGVGGAHQDWVVFPGVSVGKKGSVWPWDDYVYFDDVAEVWWDSTKRGDDELGISGTGMFQFANGGRRYAPGDHPRTDTRAFETSGAIAVATGYPAKEKPPTSYPHKHFRG